MKNCNVYLSLLMAILACCTPSKKADDAKENVLFNKWLHHPKSQLIQSWGPPDSTITVRKGGEILIYKEKVDYKSVMDQKYTGTLYSFRKEMYINADSLIYYWRAWRRKP